jgi:6-pyruvoyltetrahydropterin/6-carboxytetrahydropterin synthase
MITTLQTQFSCAHRYVQKQWSEEKNRQVFGKCYFPHGHGHDYRLQVSFKGNSKKMKRAIALLKAKLDHRHLNLDIAEFSKLVPTTENVAIYCLHFLKKQNSGAEISKVILFEKDDLWVEII